MLKWLPTQFSSIMLLNVSFIFQQNGTRPNGRYNFYDDGSLMFLLLVEIPMMLLLSNNENFLFTVGLQAC